MSEPATWFTLLKTATALGAVVCVILTLAWAVKKYFHPEMWGGNSGQGIKIVQVFAVDPKKKLMVVDVQDKRMLLGVADQSISYLCPLDPAVKDFSTERSVSHVSARTS